jgi:stage II sporulation protein R
MKKILKRILICACLTGCVWAWGLIRDRQTLNEQLLRLHVVAASDSEADQAIKLRVRDAVIHSISEDLANIGDFEQAEQYIRENLPKIQQAANNALEAMGCDETAVASLGREVFDTRVYDTFTLPAGIYEALRITIGEGLGKNWWCVVFPTLCVPATSEGFEEVAVEAGLSETLTDTLEGEYEIRFYFLDLLGKLEGILWNRENAPVN